MRSCSPPRPGARPRAALAPLIERHVPPQRAGQQLAILYLLPTRALIADIANRLVAPLERLRLRLAVKTHDLDTFRPDNPADLLLTTPESLDALLATRPKTLANVRAVVLNELHVLDGSVRGDQLRAVLARCARCAAMLPAAVMRPTRRCSMLRSWRRWQSRRRQRHATSLRRCVNVRGSRATEIELRDMDEDQQVS